MHADANILERYQSQIIQILKFLVFIVLARSFYIIFLILNYTILFVRVAVVVNFINKFCSRFRTAHLSGSGNTAMAFLCSFHSRTGTSCLYDRLDKNKSLEIISLCNCSKDITGHFSHLSFFGITTESKLILARVGVLARRRLHLKSWTLFAYITGVNSGLAGGETLPIAMYRKSYPNVEQTEKQIGVFPTWYPNESLRQQESPSWIR